MATTKKATMMTAVLSGGNAQAEATLTSTGQTSIEIVKTMRALNREQFANSSLPGSELARDYAHPELRAVSLSRMAVMGLLGALGGYGIARAAGKAKGVGAGIGAALGTGGSVAYDKLRGTPSDASVVGAAVDEKTGTSIMLVGSLEQYKALISTSRRYGSTLGPNALTMKNIIKAHTNNVKKGLSSIGMLRPYHFTLPVLATKYSSFVEPPGWLGAVIQHGMKVQAGQMNFLIENADQRDPWATSMHQGYVTKKWGAESCIINANGLFCSHEGKAKSGVIWRNNFVEWPSPAWPSYGLPRSVTPESLKRDLYDIGYLRGQNWDHTFNDFWMRTLQWWAERVTQQNTARIDSYWKGSGGAVSAAFYSRYSSMVRNAQWLVWAGEMFRLHSAQPTYRPAWWATHCASWAIECASNEKLLARKNMATTKHAGWCLDTERKAVDNPLPIPLTAKALEAYLKLIVQHTPSPFTSDIYEQMTVNPYGARLMLMDMPAPLVTMMPPVDQIGKAYFEALYAQQRALGAPMSLRVFMYVFQAVVELVATYFGGAGGMVVGGVFCTLVSVAMAAAQRFAATGSSKLDANDIVAVVGTLLAKVADVVDLEDLAVNGMDDLWSTLGQIAEDYQLEDAFAIVNNTYQVVAEQLNWPYTDTLLATCQDAGSSLGLDREALNKAIGKV